jgi:hypothetical protein
MIWTCKFQINTTTIYTITLILKKQKKTKINSLFSLLLPFEPVFKCKWNKQVSLLLSLLSSPFPRTSFIEFQSTDGTTEFTNIKPLDDALDVW